MLAMFARLLVPTAVAACLLLTTGGTSASELTVFFSRGLICDTAEQIRKAIAAYDEGRNGPDEVNADEPGACGVVIHAFVKIEKIGEVHSTAKGKYDLVRVAIVAFYDDGQWHRVRPYIQVVAMPSSEGPDKAPNDAVKTLDL